MLATIQLRRGDYAQFDPQMMVSGEPAAVLAGDPSVPSGKAFYVCFQAGDVRRMVSIEDLQAMISRGDFKGDKGDRGSDGRDGRDGRDGVGIANVTVDPRSHVIVTLTNGRAIDAGGILDILEQVNADEQKRIQAEKERVAAEAERKSAEAAREMGEISREAAEQVREASEATRMDNEDARVSGEDQRKLSEADRAAAEQTRVTNERNRSTEWSKLRPAVELATAEADRAAVNANAVADDLVSRRDAGEFKGEKGDKGDAGPSGIMAPSAGLFSLWLDDAGNLYAEYPDGEEPPGYGTERSASTYAW